MDGYQRFPETAASRSMAEVLLRCTGVFVLSLYNMGN
jgi:hypothetical protein